MVPKFNRHPKEISQVFFQNFFQGQKRPIPTIPFQLNQNSRQKTSHTDRNIICKYLLKLFSTPAF